MKNRRPRLEWAAKVGQLEMVKFLLRHGAATSLPDDAEWATPLAWAIKRGHDEIARDLAVEFRLAALAVEGYLELGSL